MKIGNLDFINTLIGNTQVEKIYLGADVVLDNEPTPPTPPGPTPEIYLEVDGDPWVDAPGGFVALIVSSNTSWTLTSSNSAWAYPTVSAGTGNANLSVFFTENDDTANTRTVRFTGNASGVTDYVDITQGMAAAGQAVVRLKRNVEDISTDIGILPDYTKIDDLVKVEAYCIDTDKGPIDITEYISENSDSQGWVDLSQMGDVFDSNDVGDYYFYYTFTGDSVPISFFEEQSLTENGAMADFTEIYVSGTTREIEEYAFCSFGHNAGEDNSLLKTIIFEDGVETLGDRAFEQIFTADAVVIPQSVTYIGTNCFYDLAGNFDYGDHHISYYFQGEIPPEFSMEEDGDLGQKPQNILICVPDGCQGDYQQAIPFYEYCIEECGGCFDGYEEYGYEFDETLCDCLGGFWQDDECQFEQNDCVDWQDGGYESYEDCRCQNYGECPEE